MAKLTETEGASDERRDLFEKFSDLLEAHSHAEERAFYAAVLPDSTARERTAHGIHEHCKAAEVLHELEELDMGSGGWLQKFKSLKEDVEHHIEEEENDLFPKAKKALNGEGKAVAARFARFKREELG